MTNYSIGGSSGTTGVSAKTTPGAGDLFPLVDVSDTSTPPAGGAGSDKKVTFAHLQAAVLAAGGLAGLAPSGDTSGAADTSSIQGLLTLAGKAVLQGGLFWIDQTLLFSTGTALHGAGLGITTIKACNGYAATQVGTNPGMLMLATTGNGATPQNNISVTDLTLDMNQANVHYPLPVYASQNECAPMGLWGVNGLTLARVGVINAVGYSFYPRNCTNVTIEDCYILTGQNNTIGNITQDCIHVSDCTSVVIRGNILNSGNLTFMGNNVGDDCIAIQTIATGCSDVTITGNVIQESAARGISLVLGGAGFVRDVAISGNTIANTRTNGLVLEYGVYNASATYLISNVAIAGNVFYNLATSGAGRGIQLDDATNVGHTGPGWQDIAISNNSFVGMTNTGGQGIYVQSGTGIAISGNAFDAFDTNAGIQIGDNISGSITVQDFQVTGNTINLTTSTFNGGATGIEIIDSFDGVISGNIIIGNEVLEPGTGSAGVGLYAIGTAITGVTVTGNRITEWDTGILEGNFGAQPDFNTYTGNDTHGCTAHAEPVEHSITRLLDTSLNTLLGMR